MPKQIYLNLPVRDLGRSKEFFGDLGFSFDPRFTDDRAACLVIGEGIYVMLLEERFFRTFTDKKVVDATKSAEVLIGLSCASRSEVDDLVSKAVAAGGRSTRPPQDQGFMYGRTFEDPDGHAWELIFMTPSENWQPVEGETRVGP